MNALQFNMRLPAELIWEQCTAEALQTRCEYNQEIGQGSENVWVWLVTLSRPVTLSSELGVEYSEDEHRK